MDSNRCSSLPIVIPLLAVLPLTARGGVPVELGSASGRALCKIGAVTSASQEYETEPDGGTAECMLSSGDRMATSVSTTVFGPTVGDAAVVGERTESATELQVNARSEFDFSVLLMPIGEPQETPFVPLIASIPYTQAVLIEGELRGGCSTDILIEQQTQAGRRFGFDEFRSTRSDGVVEAGTVLARIDFDPGYFGHMRITAICGGVSNPPEGPVAIEAQAQVAQSEPLLRFDQERLDEELGADSFPLDAAYQIVYVPAPEPGTALAAAAAFAALAVLHRRARGKKRPDPSLVKMP